MQVSIKDKIKNFFSDWRKRRKEEKKAEKEPESSMVEHYKPADHIWHTVSVLFCALVAICSIIPLWHVLMSSISDGKELLAHEGMVWWPLGEVTFDGYAYIFQDSDILRGYINTIIYTVVSTLLCWFISVTAAYAMSRQTKLKKVMIGFVIIPMLFGGGMLPTYMVIHSLGMTGNPLSLIIPGCTNTMFILMMMNAFNQVTPEMYEAARIDGAGHIRTLFKIALPLVKNMSAVIILNSVVGQWNSWLPASMYVDNNPEYWPLQLFIKNFNITDQEVAANPNLGLVQYAVIIAASLPIIVVFPFFQKRLEKAVVGGGVKG